MTIAQRLSHNKQVCQVYCFVGCAFRHQTSPSAAALMSLRPPKLFPMMSSIVCIRAPISRLLFIFYRYSVSLAKIMENECDNKSSAGAVTVPVLKFAFSNFTFYSVAARRKSSKKVAVAQKNRTTNITGNLIRI
jgi:hypothetical protein